jgi:hypothetical protein
MVNSATLTPSPSNESPFPSLAAILQADVVSCEILRFLLKNRNAMDTAKGIAAWWVQRDELAVQPSLHRLFAGGAIVAHTLTSGTAIYGLTQNPDVRMWLQDALAIRHDNNANTRHQVRQTKVTAGASDT